MAARQRDRPRPSPRYSAGRRSTAAAPGGPAAVRMSSMGRSPRRSSRPLAGEHRAYTVLLTDAGGGKANPPAASFSASTLNVARAGPVTSSSGTGPGAGALWPGAKVRIWMRVHVATGSGSLPGGRNQMSRPLPGGVLIHRPPAELGRRLQRVARILAVDWTLTQRRPVLSVGIQHLGRVLG